MQTSQSQAVSVGALVFPCCECGAPYGHHVVGSCHGYRPSRPIENWGTRVFVPARGWPLWRRMLTQALWMVEFRAQGWRERLVGGGSGGD